MFLGIDLGGTNISGGIVSEEGNILKKLSLKTDAKKGQQYIINNMITLIKKLINNEKNTMKGIGIGVPGTFLKEKGIVEFACNINFRNVELAKKIKDNINVPIYINNDGNCAALGESFSGGAQEYNSSVMITIGTGIGSGIILDNKIYDGFNSAAGELGHMVIIKDGISCSCGRRGCFERYASANALISQAKECLKNKDYNESLIFQLTNNNLEKINGEVIFEAAKKEDFIAKKLIDNYIDYLSEGLANIINILEPEALIIGGGISQQGNFLINLIKDKTYKLIYSKTLPKTEIKAAKLGSDAGLIGAAMLCTGNISN